MILLLLLLFSQLICKLREGSLKSESCPTLCDPMDWGLPGSIHGIFQERILEWIAISFSRGSS